MKRFIALVAGICAASITVLALPGGTPIRSHPAAYTQLTGLNTCGTDATSALSSFINGAPDGTTITLPHNACFLVNSSLLIQGTNNVTINGNGSTFKQTKYPGWAELELYSNNNLTIQNLTIDGAAVNGAAGGEANYGVTFESNNGVTLTGDTIENTGGDWVYLQPPNDTHGLTNTNVTFNGDTFLNAGYHGFTVESSGCWTTAPCNGLTVENSTMTNIQVDGIDYEVDIASTDWTATNGVPSDFAQDYTTFTNNTWTNMNGSNWFTSDQGQVNHTTNCPSTLGCGVDQQYLVLTNNTINDNAPFMEVVGTDAHFGAASNLHMTVTGNKYSPGYTVKPYRGGTSVAISLQNEYGMTFSNNTLPWCPNANYPACDGTPTEYEMYLTGAYNTVENNNFYGAIAPLDPTSGTNGPVCGNTFGQLGKQTDTPCH